MYTFPGGVHWIFADFEFYMAVLGVGRGPIGLVAPLRLKILDSQPDPSNMGPVSIDFHEFQLFRKSCHRFRARYLLCFRPIRLKVGFSGFWAGIKKMRDEKLRRFVVLSPLEVPSLMFPCRFEFLNVRSFVKAPS